LCDPRGPSNFQLTRSVFPHPLRGVGSRTSLHSRWRLGSLLFGAFCIEHRSIRDECSQGQRVYVSKSDATQKIERRRVDGNEQSILAEPNSVGDSHQTVKSPDFLVRRGPARGEASAVYLTHRRCDIPQNSIGPAATTFDRLYPTRRKSVWSKLLSFKAPVGRRLHMCLVKIHEAS